MLRLILAQQQLLQGSWGVYSPRWRLKETWRIKVTVLLKFDPLSLPWWWSWWSVTLVLVLQSWTLAEQQTALCRCSSVPSGSFDKGSKLKLRQIDRPRSTLSVFCLFEPQVQTWVVEQTVFLWKEPYGVNFIPLLFQQRAHFCKCRKKLIIKNNCSFS